MLPNSTTPISPSEYQGEHNKVITARTDISEYLVNEAMMTSTDFEILSSMGKRVKRAVPVIVLLGLALICAPVFLYVSGEANLLEAIVAAVFLVPFGGLLLFAIPKIQREQLRHIRMDQQQGIKTIYAVPLLRKRIESDGDHELDFPGRRGVDVPKEEWKQWVVGEMTTLEQSRHAGVRLRHVRKSDGSEIREIRRKVKVKHSAKPITIDTPGMR